MELAKTVEDSYKIIFPKYKYTVIQWLKDNETVANPSKFQLMFLSNYPRQKY